ncbi:MAG: (4Fe-4S)-binding protein [bacterium]|nr:(4Fe-4S)-binding protein [bacterium]
MRDKLTKKYSNGEITVIWKPDLCIHSTLCWKGLGSVFNPKERPWVKIDGATSDQIIAQVDKCPSGALSYQRDSATPPAESAKPATTVEVTENGPLILTGSVTLRHANGQEEVRDRTTAFCRCGQSGKKPFCDGSHTRTGFKG